MSGRDNRGSGHQPLSNAMGKIKDKLTRSTVSWRSDHSYCNEMNSQFSPHTTGYLSTRRRGTLTIEHSYQFGHNSTRGPVPFSTWTYTTAKTNDTTE